MRPIKFRIYDKARKEWVRDTENAFNLLGELVIMGEILRRPDDTGVKLSELNDLEVMQFTGLLDKNGKEIYEGDVVEDPKIHTKRWLIELSQRYRVRWFHPELHTNDISHFVGWKKIHWQHKRDPTVIILGLAIGN